MHFYRGLTELDRATSQALLDDLTGVIETDLNTDSRVAHSSSYWVDGIQSGIAIVATCEAYLYLLIDVEAPGPSQPLDRIHVLVLMQWARAPTISIYSHSSTHHRRKKVR